MRYSPLHYREVREILDWARTFHGVLAREFECMAHGPVKERVAMLLTYLSQHEKTLELAIKHFKDDAHEGLLNTWHDHFPDLNMPDNLDELKSHLATIETDEVIRLAVQFHDALVDIYEKVRDAAPSQEVKDVFENLILMENREKERIIRDSAMLEDY